MVLYAVRGNGADVLAPALARISMAPADLLAMYPALASFPHEQGDQA
jgi:hypothetical protein